MASYDYKCSSCDYQSEYYHKMDEKPVILCPKCKDIQMDKLMNIGLAVHFKGSGFYQTDYKGKK